MLNSVHWWRVRDSAYLWSWHWCHHLHCEDPALHILLPAGETRENMFLLWGLRGDRHVTSVCIYIEYGFVSVLSVYEYICVHTGLNMNGPTRTLSVCLCFQIYLPQPNALSGVVKFFSSTLSVPHCILQHLQSCIAGCSGLPGLAPTVSSCSFPTKVIRCHVS